MLSKKIFSYATVAMIVSLSPSVGYAGEQAFDVDWYRLTRGEVESVIDLVRNSAQSCKSVSILRGEAIDAGCVRSVVKSAAAGLSRAIIKFPKLAALPQKLSESCPIAINSTTNVACYQGTVNATVGKLEEAHKLLSAKARHGESMSQREHDKSALLNQVADLNKQVEELRQALKKELERQKTSAVHHESSQQLAARAAGPAQSTGSSAQ